MSPRTTDRTVPRRDLPRGTRVRWWWILAGIAVAAGLVATNRLMAGPPFVERITVVNPTPYGVDVELSRTDHGPWLQLGEAEKRSTTVYEEVLDQGATWVVRLADGEGGELRFTRAELVHAGWRVEIPAAMEARLRPTWGPPERLA